MKLALLFPLSIFLLPSLASAQTIDTVLGNGQAENNGHTGKARELSIGDPFGVEIGPDGALYATEVGNHRIWRIDLSTGQAAVVVGNGTKGYSGDGGLAIEAQLNEPYEVRFDKRGNMYFVEMQNHIVRRVDAKTQIITTVAGTGKAGFSGDGGPAIKAQFSRPHSIALDDDDNLYIADISNHRIRKVNLKTNRVETIAGDGTKSLPRDGGSVLGKPLVGPRALYIVGNQLWIALREGHSVWRLDLNSQIIHRIAGTGEKGFSGDNGDPKSATFNGPKGIVVDQQGVIYVVDTENQAIRMIDLQRKVISTLAGRGPNFKGMAGDGQAANKCSLDRPHGICVDQARNVYIGDTLNHRVRVIKP